MSPIARVLRSRFTSLLWLSLLLPLSLAAVGPEQRYYGQGILIFPPETAFERLPAMALSGSGNTAFVSTTCVTGCDTGIVHIFNRSRGTWSEGPSLNVGTLPNGQLGWALDVSSDGNTLIVGALADYQAGSPAPGAAVIWSRLTGAWTRQATLSGGNTAVAISADGNTVVVSGVAHFPQTTVNETGAWVYVRSGSSWVRQARLTDVPGDAALSADGNTALVGGAVYVRSNGAWSQQAALPGAADAVFLSADGKTALISGGLFTLDETGWIMQFSFGGGLRGVGLSPDGKVFSAANDEQAVMVRFDENLTLLADVPLLDTGFGAAFSSDGSTGVIGHVRGVIAIALSQQPGLRLVATLVGDHLTLSATVTSPNLDLTGAPDGLVGFTENGRLISDSIARLSAEGTATYTTTLTQQGTHSYGFIFATVNPFLSDGRTSPGAASVSYGGPPAVSTMSFEILPAAPTIGQTITFLATVQGANRIAAPSGGVQFFDGGKLLGIGSVFNGQARFLTTLPRGNHSISAIYTGDGNYPPASAPAVGLTVSRLPLAISLRSGTSTSAYGRPVTLAAAFATAQAPKGIAPPSGKVQFYSGTAGLFGMLTDRTLLGEAAIVDGAASLTTTALPAGQPLVVAVYLGDDNWSNGSSNTLTQVVTAP